MILQPSLRGVPKGRRSNQLSFPRKRESTIMDPRLKHSGMTLRVRLLRLRHKTLAGPRNDENTYDAEF